MCGYLASREKEAQKAGHLKSQEQSCARELAGRKAPRSCRLDVEVVGAVIERKTAQQES